MNYQKRFEDRRETGWWSGYARVLCTDELSLHRELNLARSRLPSQCRTNIPRLLCEPLYEPSGLLGAIPRYLGESRLDGEVQRGAQHPMARVQQPSLNPPLWVDESAGITPRS